MMQHKLENRADADHQDTASSAHCSHKRHNIAPAHSTTGKGRHNVAPALREPRGI